MVQKRKINTKKPVNRKSASALSGKSKMGDTSLDWISDTSESEMIVEEQAENKTIKTAKIHKKTNQTNIINFTQRGYYKAINSKENVDTHYLRIITFSF